MQEYDVALKLLLQGSAKLTMRELTGTAIAKWLDVELPKVQNLRLDLLGQTVDGGLIHLELQSRQRCGDAVPDDRILSRRAAPVRTVPTADSPLRGRSADAHGEQTARPGLVIRISSDRHKGTGRRAPAGERGRGR